MEGDSLEKVEEEGPRSPSQNSLFYWTGEWGWLIWTTDYTGGPGALLRVAVDHKGKPWAIDSKNRLWKWAEHTPLQALMEIAPNFEHVHDNIRATDICIDNKGNVYVVVEGS
jgi:hypothetical protein